MATDNTLRNPVLSEIATPDEKLWLGADAYLRTLKINPDTVLAERGPTLTVYEQLLRDDQVRSTFQQRRTAVIQSEWQVEPATESAQDKAVADFITEQLHRVKIDQKTDKMLYGIFYGWSVAECIWAREGNRITLADIKVRDRARFGYNYAGDLMLINTKHPMGLKMPPRKFWQFSAGASHDDNPYGLGLAHSVYWPVFFKRNDLKFWLIFLEKFGQPTAAAKLPPGQVDLPEERTKALNLLAQIQTDAGIVIPDNVVIELIEAARSGTADYDRLRAAMDAAISKVVLSQTMTTDDGSSLAQAKVHQGVADHVIKSDADLICDSLNTGPIAWLTEWNFPGSTPPRLWRQTEPPEDLNARAERDGKISALGYEPTEDYITETYGPGWQKKQAPPALPPGATGPLGPEFAEISKLAQDRVAHRADQQDILNAAAYLATRYRDLYGSRVEQLIQYLENTQDFATFSERVTQLLAEAAPAQAVETVQRATIVARLMGRLRGQR